MVDSASDRQRIVFLDHLRGLACLMVVFGHVYLMGINDPGGVSGWLPFVQGPIFGPDSPGFNPFNRVTTWMVLSAGISFGPMGVSVFFLISGFIILRAVDHESPGRFLVRRGFRIFPLSIVVAVGTGLYTALLCWHEGVASPHTLRSVFASAFAVTGFIGAFSTIPVIWSLTIELFFYLMMAGVAALVPRIEVRHLALMAVACAVLSTLTQLAPLRERFSAELIGAFMTLGYCAFHACYLLIGSALYRATQARFDAAGVKGVLLLGGIFGIDIAASMAYGDVANTGTTIQNALVAFAIFVSAMLFGLRWRAIRWFTFFGDVSYPLYLLHIPGAWAVMFVLSRLGLGMHAATILALATCVAVAWVLHVTIEMPLHALGRSLTRGDPSPRRSP